MAAETPVQKALREARERDTAGGSTPSVAAPTVTTADTATLRETSKSGHNGVWV